MPSTKRPLHNFEDELKVLHTGSPGDRLIAIHHLAVLRDQRALPHLTNLLRVGAVERFRLRRGWKRDFEVLTDSRIVKLTALHALDQISHPDAIPHIAKLLDHPEKAVQTRAAVALMDIFEAVQKKKEHQTHPAVKALKAIVPHLTLDELGYPVGQYYVLLKKALELAMKKPQQFKDAATTQKTMHALHEKHVKPKIVVSKSFE